MRLGWFLVVGALPLVALVADGCDSEPDCEVTLTCSCESDAQCAEQLGDRVTECTQARCGAEVSGVCGLVPAPAGTACELGVCDGDGNCVPGGAGGSGGNGQGGGGAGATGGQGGTGGCSADLQTDAANCGVCNHSCMGAGCTAGQCEGILIVDGFTGGGDIDLEANVLYFMRGAAIHSVPADGDDVESSEVVSATNMKSFDVDGGVAYFSHIQNLHDGWVSKQNVSGGAITALGGYIGAQFDRNLYGVRVSGTSVFFGDPSGGNIDQLPTSGGSPTSFATGENGVLRTTIAGGNLYWVTAAGRARSKPLLGGSVTTVGDLGTAGPHSITANNDAVVWASEGDGAVYSRIGASVGTVTTDISAPADVQIDGSRVYVAGDGEGLFVIGIDGNGLERLAPNVTSAWRIAIDEDWIYWTTDTEVWRVVKPPM